MDDDSEYLDILDPTNVLTPFTAWVSDTPPEPPPDTPDTPNPPGQLRNLIFMVIIQE